MLILLAALSASAAEPAWEVLSDDSEWKEVGTRKSSIGEISLRSKRIAGVGCVEARVVVEPSPERLVAITRDMASAIDWSSADLRMSQKLASDEDSFVVLQYLHSPGWSFAADRYWVVRGEPRLTGDRGSYRWYRVEAQGYPEAVEQVRAISSNAIELPTNYGEWTFIPVNAGTALQYRSCADFGGRVPTAFQQWLNFQQTPAFVADLVVEAGRR